ncbi:MAG: type IX secretion system membrane protein PorP/SprF [Vicingaceae bacterium]|nr:type IX secretion system membrane protein PorP/SprF [Vicingaceae bacterium]
MKKTASIFLIVFSTIGLYYGQNESFELPVYYGQFFNDPQINAIGFDNENLILTLGHQRNSNNFGGINTTLFSGRYQTDAKKNSGHHTFGLQFVSDKEGFLIRRNRAGITYGRHLKVSEKYNVAGGFTGGFYNFSIVSNDVTGGISSYTFDGAFSLSFYSDKTRVGLTLNQMTNPTLQPLDQKITLTRHLNTFVEHDFDVGEDFKITPSALGRFSKSTASVFSGFYSAIGLRALFQQHILAGASMELDNGYYFFLGGVDIPFLSSRFDFNFSYFIPSLKNKRSYVNRYEIFIRYKLGAQRKSK